MCYDAVLHAFKMMMCNAQSSAVRRSHPGTSYQPQFTEAEVNRLCIPYSALHRGSIVYAGQLKIGFYLYYMLLLEGLSGSRVER
jgi:hypothetical protein